MLANAARKSDHISRRAIALQACAGYGKALLAIAAKNARIAWALLAKGEAFKPA
jgi:transposase